MLAAFSPISFGTCTSQPLLCIVSTTGKVSDSLESHLLQQRNSKVSWQNHMLACQSRTSSWNSKRGVGNESVPGQQMRDCTVDSNHSRWRQWGAMTLMGINMCSIKWEEHIYLWGLFKNYSKIVTLLLIKSYGSFVEKIMSIFPTDTYQLNEIFSIQNTF